MMWDSAKDATRHFLAQRPRARVVILGGTGFVGSSVLSLVDQCQVPELAWDITVASTKMPSADFFRRFEGAKVSWRYCDVTSEIRLPVDYEIILHAASPSHGHRLNDPTDVERTLVTGAEHLVAWMSRFHAPPRLVHASSGAAGVAHTRTPLSTLKAAQDPYTRGKIAAEGTINDWARTNGVSLANARLFAFVGPQLPRNAHFAVGNFLDDALNGRDVVIQGTGSPVRGYLLQEDMATWLIALLVNQEVSGCIDVGSASGLSLAEVAGLIAGLCGVSVKVIGDATKDGQRLEYLADTRRAISELGVVEWTYGEAAIRHTVQVLCDPWHVVSPLRP